MSSKRIKYFIFFFISFTAFSSFGQSHKEELKLCKDRRLKTHDYTCTGDTAKRTSCDSLIGNYLLQKERYFIKHDSIQFLIDEMNKTGSEYYYYLQMDNIVYFDWGVCDSKNMGNGAYIEKGMGFYDRWDDILDFKVVIAKESKFNLHLNGSTSGKTFYREDVK